jgi:hypothetical protein
LQKLAMLGAAAADCVSALAACTLLQTQLFQAGVIWRLLPNLFHFDYTLDEGGSPIASSSLLIVILASRRLPCGIVESASTTEQSRSSQL